MGEVRRMPAPRRSAGLAHPHEADVLDFLLAPARVQPAARLTDGSDGIAKGRGLPKRTRRAVPSAPVRRFDDDDDHEAADPIGPGADRPRR